MTSSTSGTLNTAWPLIADNSKVEMAKPAKSGEVAAGMSVSVPRAALAMLRDSVLVLSAFAWGDEARLSRNKSAELCDLMENWHGIK